MQLSRRTLVANSFIIALALGACQGAVSAGLGDSSNGDGGLSLGEVGIEEPGVVPPGGTELQLEITSPPRGATLTGEPTVTVEGRAGQINGLTLNGEAVTPAGDGTGSFSHTVQAVHGMNVLILEGTDEKGTKQKLVQSFYHSKRWLKTDPAKPGSALIKDALVGWLGQPIFDSNGARMDIATVIEKELAKLDVASLVPSSQRINNVAGCDHADIQISSVAVNPGDVSLTTVADGLTIKVAFTGLRANVKADLSGKWYNPACLIGVKGKIMASSVEVTAKIKAWVEGTALKASATQTSAKVHGFNIDISGIWGFLTNWLVNKFEDDLAKDLEKMLTDELNKQVGPLLAKGIGGMAFNETLEAAPPLGGGQPVAVKLVSRLGALSFQAGGARYGLDATAVASPVVEHASLGSIGRACGSTAFAVADKGKHPMQLAISDDFVNQLLYSFHSGGLLQATLTPEDAESLGGSGMAGLADLQGSLDALLPPLINTCKEGGPVLQLGDLRLKLEFSLLGQPVKMAVHVALEAPVKLEAESQRVKLSIGEPSLLEVESKDLGDGSSTVFDTVRALLESQLMPKLIESLGNQSVSIPIPDFDLEGTKVRLEVDNVVNRDGYAVVGGSFQ